MPIRDWNYSYYVSIFSCLICLLSAYKGLKPLLTCSISDIYCSGLLSAYKGLKRKNRGEGVVVLSDSLLSAYKGLKRNIPKFWWFRDAVFIKCL